MGDLFAIKKMGRGLDWKDRDMEAPRLFKDAKREYVDKDFNLDGFKDRLVVSGNRLEIFFGGETDEKNKVELVVLFEGKGPTYILNVSDYDKDGDLDIYIEEGCDSWTSDNENWKCRFNSYRLKNLTKENGRAEEELMKNGSRGGCLTPSLGRKP